MSSTPLQRLREELDHPRVPRRELARKAGVSQQTYHRAESGRRVTHTTAMSILGVLNAERQARGAGPVTLDQLGIRLV